MGVRVLMVVAALAFTGTSALAGTVYVDGTSPNSGSLTFGDHQVGGAHASVAGALGGGISNDGDTLNKNRTYIWDKGAAPDLADGIANRGDTGFAMLIWDMGSAFNSMRLFTHQDHYNGGPITTSFTAQDVMEYSVWGSQNGDDFVLLSDVTAFDINGGGSGKPTYTFGGTEASTVYRGGSAEYGIVNAYTRDYVFGTAYRFYGIRTSTISLVANDADPELDAIAGFTTVLVPLPPAAFMGLGLLGGLGLLSRLRRRRRSAV